MQNKIKAVLVDIDNTLLDFNACARLSMKTAFEKNGLDYNDQTFSVFSSVNNGLWQDVEKKLITIDELHKIRFNKIFVPLGIDYDGWLVEKEFLKALKSAAIPVDGALELVKYLSSKYVFCTASNAPTEQQLGRLTVSGILPYVNHAFISGQIGFNKPDKRFFDACFNTLAPIVPEECVMIGDSLSADISGASAYGIKTVWFNPENKAAPSGLTPDYSVRSLKEILNIL